MNNLFDLTYEFSAEIKTMRMENESDLKERLGRDLLLAEFKYKCEKDIMRLRAIYLAKINKQ
jgi:hypothetical protein